MSGTIPNLALANGVDMPALGLGVYRSSPEETTRAVLAALATGYRLVDTAAAYGNERQVGEALRRSGVARGDVFVATKLWISEYGFDRSLRKLGLDALDLYLLHQPMPNDWERTIAAWRAAERLLAEGRTRAIGVCNFSSKLLADLIERTGVAPAVNQVELHPSSPSRSSGPRTNGSGSPRRPGRQSGASPATGATVPTRPGIR